MRQASIVAIFTLLIGLFCLCLGARPWQRRRAVDVEVRHKLAYESVSVELWPDEPVSPNGVSAERLAVSIQRLCLWMPRERALRYAAAVLEASETFSQDPFLLGALMFERSSCLPRTPEGATGFGLTRIDLQMHGPHIRGRQYRFYRSGSENSWERDELAVGAYPFNRWKLQKPEPNFYFAAAVLSVFERQCADLDSRLGGVEHRHFVSHFYFGDRVGSSEPEDRVLTVRRRLIEYYASSGLTAAGHFEDVELTFPLDGTPRLLIDYFGNSREYRRQRGYFHKGVDIEALLGEPVRALAGGRVAFAGVDLKGPASSRALSPDQTIPKRSQMGPGGLYVCVNHHRRFKSCYMHLSELKVRGGQTVEAGDVIGLVGASGTSQSGSHLHLELRSGGRHVDPMHYLKRGMLVPVGLREEIEKKSKKNAIGVLTDTPEKQ